MAEDAAPVESPCIRECVIEEATGWCRGCYRTLDEISFWMRYTHEERRRVMTEIPLRCAAARRPHAQH